MAIISNNVSIRVSLPYNLRVMSWKNQMAKDNCCPTQVPISKACSKKKKKNPNPSYNNQEPEKLTININTIQEGKQNTGVQLKVVGGIQEKTSCLELTSSWPSSKK